MQFDHHRRSPQQQQPQKPHIAVAYFYFNFQNREEQQFVNLLRSMILQLSCQCQKFPSCVENLYHRLQYRHDQPSLTSSYLTSIVQKLIREFEDVFLVLDALDECEQYEESLEWVQELAIAKDGILHLLVSSRQTQVFRSILEPIATDLVSVNEFTPAKDIQLHIREQLKSDSRMKKWPSDLQDQIESTLMANVDGS
jgi:predicted DNA-binding protein